MEKQSRAEGKIRPGQSLNLAATSANSPGAMNEFVDLSGQFFSLDQISEICRPGRSPPPSHGPVEKCVIPKSNPSGGCFVCTMRAMEEELFAAGDMNSEFANETFQRLKKTCEEYDHSESSRLEWSSCKLHSRNTAAVKNVVWNLVDLLMASFQQLNQRDGELAAELLQIAYFFTSYQTIARRHRARAKRTHVAKTPLLSEFRQLLKAAYSVQHPAIMDDDSAEYDDSAEDDDKQHTVWSAIMDSQEQVLSALLRYGVMFLPSSQFNGRDMRQMDDALRCLAGRSDWTSLIPFLNPFLDNCRRQLGWPLHRVIIVLRVLVTLSYGVCESLKGESEDDPSGRKRPRLEGGSGEGSSSSDGHFRCLRRAFETIPEPFVTSEELRRASQVVSDSIAGGKETRIDEALTIFKKCYPEGEGPIAPRTLEHLGRCQVRQNLRQTGSLPHGIRHLALPDNIRKYIVLEE